MRDVSIVIWLSRRPGVKMTAMAAVLAGTSLVLSGAAPAAGRQLARTSLDYTCRAPAGWQPMPVQVAVSFPGTATAGQPIQPTAPVITVTVPHADAERLAKLDQQAKPGHPGQPAYQAKPGHPGQPAYQAKPGHPGELSHPGQPAGPGMPNDLGQRNDRAKPAGSVVTVTAQVRGEATENGRSMADPWVLRTMSARVPARGNLVVQVPGAVAPVTEPTAGEVTFTAPGLSLLPGPGAAHGVIVSSPRTTILGCTLNPGQAATLATVPVAAAAGRAAAAPRTADGHFTTGLWESGPGGSFSGTSTQATLTDAATHTMITCKSSSMSGTFKSGQQVPPAGIGSITSVTVQKCTGPGSKSFTVVTPASASQPWLVNAQSFSPTLNVVTGTISSIMASVRGPGCSATVAGPSSTVPGTAGVTNSINSFTEADTLSVGSGGTLRVWNVSGCSGLFNSGDALTLTAAYAVTPTQWLAPAYCPPFPVKKGFPFNKKFKFPTPPPGSTRAPRGPPTQGCAFIKGFTNVQKLDGAALVGPGFGNIQKGRRIIENIPKNQYIQIDSSGELYYKPCPGKAPQCKAIPGLPPVHATFLSFGFMPTTATLQITQVGTLTIVSVSTGVTLKFSRVQSFASIRVEKVLVNGAPLNVGSDCHSVRPFLLELSGVPPYSLDFGGVLQGKVDVPPFTGCGVGENLDPIFNATVSGPGNLAQLTQGTLCSDWPVAGNFPTAGCPPNVPKPVH